MSGNSVAGMLDLGDGLGDWRIHAITRLEKDLPDRGPGRRAKPAGSVVAVVREMQPRTGERFSYVDFSSTALALNIAIAADRRAAELRTHVTPEKFEIVTGSYHTIPDDKLSGFYDFIEQSMIAILFSYQALEAFSNLTIQEELGDTGTYTVTRTIAKVKQKIAWTAPDVERKCSTEEKITEIVPKLLGKSFTKGNTVGQSFTKLKKIRDDVTHLKYRDQRGAAMANYGGDSSSVFFRMVNGDYLEIPRTAVTVLDYFTKPTGTPRWLRFPLSLYDIVPTEATGTTRIKTRPVERSTQPGVLEPRLRAGSGGRSDQKRRVQRHVE
jgi:hypothetical protein